MSSDDKTKTAAVGKLTRYLTQRKLRKTPERFAILDKVFDLSEHFSVEELHAAMLAEDGYHVSCATVYHTLELLVEAGLVRRRTFGRKSARYEHIEGMPNHHHLVCAKCGKVREIKDSAVDTLLASLKFGSFKPTYADLYIYGICSRCSRKGAASAGRKKNANKKQP